MKVTFVTVNFNHAHATGTLLKSFEQQTDGDFDVIIVDNASGADDRNVLDTVLANDTLRPRVMWSEVNGGFAAGTNIGIRAAIENGAEWVVLVNNDTVTRRDFVAALKRELGRMEPAIVALPLEEHGRIVRAGLIRWLSATLTHAHETPAPGRRIYAIGGGMAVHASVIRRWGFLDERYFLYFEDAAFSEHARRGGIPILISDVPALIHEVSASTSALGAALLLRYHARNALLFNRSYGPWWVQIMLPFWALYLRTKQMVKLLFHIGIENQSRAIVAGINDYRHRRWGIII